jgi:hypothetical protein
MYNFSILKRNSGSKIKSSIFFFFFWVIKERSVRKIKEDNFSLLFSSFMLLETSLKPTLCAGFYIYIYN